jgi:hypothetical protein
MKRLMLAALAATLLACGGDGPTPPASIAGTWHLVTINGSPLPFTIPGTDSTAAFTYISDVIMIADDGTWIEDISGLQGGVYPGVFEADGTYTRVGTDVVLHSAEFTGSGFRSATFTGPRLDLMIDDYRYVYSR